METSDNKEIREKGVFTRDRAICILGILLLFVAVSVLRYKIRPVTDDAFITYRYARNLIRGKGLVYNYGERVLGTTTPLYTLVISVAMILGVAPWTASLVLDCFLVTGFLFLILQFGEMTGNRAWALLTVTFMFLEPYSTVPIGGMETGLFIFLVYFSFYLSAKGKRRGAVAFATLSVFTRPEGILALILVLAPALFDRKRKKIREDWLRIILIAAIPLLLAAVFMKSYYGSYVLQSMKAKHALSNAGGTKNFFYRGFLKKQFFPYDRFQIKGVLEWIGFCIILIWYAPLRNFVLWLIFYIVFMKIGKAPTFNRYYTPLYPIQWMGCSMALVSFVRLSLGLIQKKIRIPERIPIQKLMKNTVFVYFLCFLIFLICCYSYVCTFFDFYYWIYFSDRDAVDCKKYEKAGEWIRLHSSPGEEVVAAEIGYIGYFSERPIYDVMGLVSPEAVKYLGKTSIWEAAMKRKSPFVVYPFWLDQFTALPFSFTQTYEIAGSWVSRKELTVVFQRKEGKPGEKDTEQDNFLIGMDPRRSIGEYVFMKKPY